MSEVKTRQDHDVTAFVERLGREARRLRVTGSSWLVGVSGGPDSMALLHAAVRVSERLALRLEAACVDHALRAGSAAEVAEVGATVRGLGLPFHTARLVLDPAAGVEAQAREARYAALQRLRTQRGLDFVATAHTADDQAETVLMRLARGTSLSGAGGILEARADRVIRPLLFATRHEVEGFVRALGVAVVRDPMNADRSFLRVRVREQVLPVYEREAGPGVVRALARFASLAAEDEACLNGQATSAWLRVAGPGGLDAVGVRGLVRPVRRRVMARFLVENGLAVDAATVDEMLTAVEERRPATLPRDRVLTGQDVLLRIEPSAPRAQVDSAGPLHASSRPGHGREVD